MEVLVALKGKRVSLNFTQFTHIDNHAYRTQPVPNRIFSQLLLVRGISETQDELFLPRVIIVNTASKPDSYLEILKSFIPWSINTLQGFKKIQLLN